MALIHKALLAIGILGCTAAFRWLFKIYERIWRYATTRDYLVIVLADMFAGLTFYILNITAMPAAIDFLRTFSIFTLIALITVSSRLVYKMVYDRNRLRAFDMSAEYNNRIRIAIVGAGNVGTMLAKELQRNPYAHYEPYCFIDMDPHKANSIISGIRVVAEKEGEDIVEQIKHMPIQEIVIALPKLTGDEKRAVYEKYAKTGCKVKLYDYPFELGGGSLDDTPGRTLREFKIEDLLFRESIAFDSKTVKPMYQDKTILVTGGGGSIGSEICRQLAKLHPKRLVVLDIYENSAYDIQQELIRKYGDNLDIAIEIGSVRDKKRLEEVFAMHKPQVVFHAAAHKHVPLMEHSCGEAIKNNVFGTLNTVETAEAFGVEKFLLISTDKAVNPTNVMGASKRMCEMIVQSRKSSKTCFVAVRFGNVLGSNGSVIPLFTRQIQNGGPITITDKRIIRYFMTIPEATQLVLQTCAMASPGEIYVLDMGRPVKILEMAENMIKLCGLTPYVDIDIQEIGLRPGEKLYEELLIKTEELDKTDSTMIFIERDQALSHEQIERKLALLKDSLESGDPQTIVNAMHEAVPTYCKAEEVNARASESAEMRIVTA